MILWFVIPALDERGNLPTLGRRVRRAAAACGGQARVVLVDDGSRDGTGDAAPAAFDPLPVTVVRHEENRGVAAAFRSGFEVCMANGSDGDLVVTLEADNTSDVDKLPRLVDEVRTAANPSGADLVLGSCYAPGGGVQDTDFLRLVVSGAANLLVKGWFGLWGLHTFSSFYRVYRLSALRQVFDASGGDPLREPGFESMVELLVRFTALGKDVREVPVVLRSGERIGKSKMRVGRTTLGYFKVMWRLGPGGWRCRKTADGFGG